MKILSSFFLFFLILTLIVLLLQIIASWKIFTKAGEAGWKSLVPFYSSYVLYRICWKTTMFWVMIAVSLIGAFCIGRVDSSFLPIIGRALAFSATIINVFSFHKLSKAFGHGIGFTFGLTFFNPFFMLILGLGSSEYKGAQE